EELLHFLGDELARLGVEGGQAVLVHEHGLVVQPRLPGLLRDVLVDPLPELARPRRALEPLGLAAELHAFHHSCHQDSLSWASRRLTGAASPRSSGWRQLYQTVSSVSMTLPAPFSTRAGTGRISR